MIEKCEKLNAKGKLRSTRLQNDAITNYAGTDELWMNENYLKNYNEDIVRKLSKFSNENLETLEFGAGLGTLSKIWESTNNTKPECLEIDPSLRKILLDRGFTCYENLQEINKTYDIIFTSNVLEHIKEDVSALKQLNKKMKVKGFLAIYVPAFMCLYNQMDSSVGHYRRYDKDELIKKVLLANFRIKECYYSDSIGFFIWLMLKFKGIGINNKISSDKSLKIYDKLVYPLSTILDRLGLKYLFGKNIVVIAQKY